MILSMHPTINWKYEKIEACEQSTTRTCALEIQIIKIAFKFILINKLQLSFIAVQKSTKDTTLDIGEDRLVLNVNPDKYHLDLDLPFDVDNETCGAQYNRKTKVMDIN